MQLEKAAVKKWTVIFLMVSSVPAPVAASDAPVAPAGKHGVACVCVYYPHWHVYPKGNEWFHPGWTGFWWGLSPFGCEKFAAKISQYVVA